MVYDCFMFFNELDLLDIRLNIMDRYVDKFVIVESTTTHSGKIKKLFFDENKDRYKKFSNKIIYIIKNEYNIEKTRKRLISLNVKHNESINSEHWLRETENRNAIFGGLIKCDNNDIILISDIDEIPDLSKINLEIIKNNTIYDCEGTISYYYFNALLNINWINSKILKYSTMINNDLMPTEVVRISRDVNRITIPNCGWHFSFIGDDNQIKYKLNSFMHQEMVNKNVLNSVNYNFKNLKDLFSRNSIYKVTDLTFLPKHILDNIELYKKYILL